MLNLGMIIMFKESAEESVKICRCRCRCRFYENMPILPMPMPMPINRFITINEANDFHNTVTHFSGLDLSQISEANKDSFRSLCKTYENNINIDEAIIYTVEYDTFKDVLESIRPSLSSAT
ncbi:unnamed protein product [Rotaria magnacalcarata]|uniref:Uncharacterized protein n=1 Tax=Rotaria magnacalcarata TaxID=392030 RepID=A0A816Z261_9BILA|nr:unnamed protein product [Rotaria magnacalcarata]CAF4369380.1 unnamed protein product [Rotaria magnacalcarata]